MHKRRNILIFIAFVAIGLFMITFASEPAETVRVITRNVSFIDGVTEEELAKYVVEVGTGVTPPEVKPHDDKVFAGWYNYYDNSIKIDDFSTILNDTTVVALYGEDINKNGIADINEEKYLVTFVNGITNEIIKEEYIFEGTDAEAPASPKIDGYTFEGWNNSYTNVKSNLTITSIHNKEEIKKVTVKQTKADNIVLPDKKEVDIIEEKIDTEVIHKYILTINYVYEDGTNASNPQVINLENGQVYIVNSPDANKKGYTADKPIIFGTMPEKDVTETVIYLANELDFDCENVIKEYSINDQTFEIKEATNGSGSYEYSIKSNDYFTINNNKITIKGKTDSGNYEIVVDAKDIITKMTKEAICKIKINETTKNIDSGSCNDLTYSGNAQTLVSNGNHVTYENNSEINSGDYIVTVKADKNYVFSDGSKISNLTCSIKKADSVCPLISGYTGDYDEESHTLNVTGGSGGTIEYSLDNENWLSTLEVTDAGETIAYVRVSGDNNHNSKDCGYETININKVDSVCPLISGYTGYYDKEGHTLNIIGGSGGTIEYSLDNENWFSTLEVTDVGETIVYVRINADNNHNSKDCGYETISIGKVDAKCPSLREFNGNYDGESHSITVGTTQDGIIQFKKASSSEWNTTLPTRTNVGTTVVNVRVIGDKNHNDKICSNKNINISSRRIVIKADDQTKAYDGNPLEANPTCSIKVGTLVPNHRIVCITSGSITEIGSGEKILENVIIKDIDEVDVSDNYLIEKWNGTLTVY